MVKGQGGRARWVGTLKGPGEIREDLATSTTEVSLCPPHMSGG